MVRRHRLLKTHGTVVRRGDEAPDGTRRVWVRWTHPTTLPNPSLEAVHDLETLATEEARGA